MLRRLRKIAAYLSYVWRAEKRWSWPQKAEILIFDACGEALLREYLGEWSVEVLHVRGESINVPVMLAALCARGRKSDAYFDFYVRCVAPRLIVTFIDNTPAFYRLSARNPGVRTMFVQNGWRSYYGDVFELLEAGGDASDKLAVDYMLCFGESIGSHYRRHIEGAVIPIGALRSNRHPRTAARLHGVIAFISQWRSEGLQLAGRTYSQEEFIGEADRCILGFLADYARAHDKRLRIIPRTRAGSADRVAEAAYFAAMTGGACAFLEFDMPTSSYEAVDAAEVVVGVDSTLVYEALARGTRTAVLSIRGTLMSITGFEFGWPEKLLADGPFWTSSPSPERFGEILDHLFGLDDAAWADELAQAGGDDLMAHDPGNRILQASLRQALAGDDKAVAGDTRGAARCARDESE